MLVEGILDVVVQGGQGGIAHFGLFKVSITPGGNHLPIFRHKAIKGISFANLGALEGPSVGFKDLPDEEPFGLPVHPDYKGVSPVGLKERAAACLKNSQRRFTSSSVRRRR
jgi:hypothetical protein